MMLKSSFVILVTALIAVQAIDLEASLHKLRNPRAVNELIDDFSLRQTEIVKRSVDHTFSRFENLHSKLRHHNFLVTLVERAFENEASLREIRDEILEAQGDVEKVVNIINSRLNEEVLQIDGDLVKFNFPKLMELIGQHANSLSEVLFPDNNFMQFIFQRAVNQSIAKHFQEWQAETQDKYIPVTVLKNLLTVGTSIARTKRDVNTANEEDSMLSFILSMFRVQLQTVVLPIRTVVDQTLTNFTITLASYYTNSEPSNYLENVIAHTKNVVIQRLLEIVVYIQQRVDSVFDRIAGTGQAELSRRRRAAGTSGEHHSGETEVTTEVPSGGGFSIITIILFPVKIILNLVVVVVRTVVVVIWKPIRIVINIFGPTFSNLIINIFVNIKTVIYNIVINIGTILYNIVIGFLGSWNCTFKQIITVTFERVRDYIATLVLEPVKEYLFVIIDRFIPCNTECVLKAMKDVL